ncbi:N-acetylmuramoyl-L-alanine amidase [Pectinatus frisingensis]|uniref:N-acetylmuramoyl-L-alanine amidase n=1 Tax=Pectinatus frisingensis TaxID=865 RepID=UPI003D80874D
MPKSLCFFTMTLFLCIILSFANIAYAGNFAAEKSSLAKITAIRISSNNDKVRIVADANKEVDYESFGLSAPNRIVIDLKGAWLDPSIQKEYTVDNKNINRIRVAQFDHATVRIVVDTSLKRDAYDVFSLASGNISYRVIMDFGKSADRPDNSAVLPVKPASPVPPAVPSAVKPTVPSPTKVFTTPGIKGKKIAIDPGHGGNDSGAIGYTGRKEKDATLQIALKLKRILENAGATVIMTRTTDTSVASPTASDVDELQARCDIANKANADIFISIHNDSFTDSAANGTSTYYYGNGSSYSSQLANDLRQGIIEKVHTPDRGTKSCNFYVVKHTDMPASLIEAAFISNPAEEKLLTSDDGSEQFAEGIYNGINKFFAAIG